MSLESLFSPASLAITGSTAPGRLGNILIHQVLEGGFPGPVYAVNPKGVGAYGVPGYPSLSRINQPVDLVVIASPASSVVDVLADAGKAGVRAAVVITSGFSESGNQSGEEEILQVARQAGIRFVGPNCAGIINTRSHLYPTLEVKPPAGGVAILTQSGALGAVILAWSLEQNLGISKFISYGNGADLGPVELLEYLAGDEETRVIALYVESVTDGRRFMQALAECSRKKPVVVIKAGRTVSGQRATASHTGSMAGSDAVYDAAIRQAGAVRVLSVEELGNLCMGFLSLPPVLGQRLAIVTNSGGPGVLAADRAEQLGLVLAEPSPAALAALQEFLPAHASLKNPVDLTVEGTQEDYRLALQAMLPEYDAALAINICPAYLDGFDLAQGIAAASEECHKPVVANFLPRQVTGPSVHFLSQKGIPSFASGEHAVETLAAMAAYTQHRQRDQECPPLALNPEMIAHLGSPRALPSTGNLLEPEAMAWLKENGFPVPLFKWVEYLDEVEPACGSLGYPVVMKVVSPHILHKSEAGGVIVGIHDGQTARRAFGQLQTGASGFDFKGVVAYPMVRGAQEVLLGLSRDPQFGPVVVFGLGGIYTEVWKDIALKVAPVDSVEALEMILSLRSTQLLQGVRGGQPCDLKRLADTLARFSMLPFLYPEISEVDLNPVFVSENLVLIGDARVIRRLIL